MTLCLSALRWAQCLSITRNTNWFFHLNLHTFLYQFLASCFACHILWHDELLLASYSFDGRFSSWTMDTVLLENDRVSILSAAFLKCATHQIKGVSKETQRLKKRRRGEEKCSNILRELSNGRRGTYSICIQPILGGNLQTVQSVLTDECIGFYGSLT